MAPIVSILLFLVAIFLGYKVYNSIMGPVEFNKAKEERYKKVIAKLKDIKAAELAYQEVVGGFNGDFDSLVQFLDTAQFAITQRRDTVYDDVEKNKAYGIDEGYYIEEVLIDTLRFTSVKDSLYAGDRYKTMMNVPGTDTKFDLDAGTLDKDGTKYAVFEAKVSKDVVLQGLNKDLITQEKMVQSVDGVNGEYLKVGSMNEVNTSGNWPKLYDTAKDQ
ncbi:MAG: hypothetical protein CMC74_05615 [Flavobacteriaceae bacterium]|nr:hypothetical protein [Flavobacteriaceae bacterium]